MGITEVSAGHRGGGRGDWIAAGGWLLQSANPERHGAWACERTAKSASRLQRRLGQLHDVDEALAQMRDAEGLSPEERAAVAEALGAERARLAHKATEELAQELETLTTLWSDKPRALPPG